MASGGFRLDLLLETARLPRSTYYYQLKQLEGLDKDKELKAEIQVIFTEHKGNYGYRRITLELRNRGFVVNHKKVQRLMSVLGLTDRIRRKRKYYSYIKERLVRKQTILFNANLKHLNQWKSAIRT